MAYGLTTTGVFLSDETLARPFDYDHIDVVSNLQDLPALSANIAATICQLPIPPSDRMRFMTVDVDTGYLDDTVSLDDQYDMLKEVHYHSMLLLTHKTLNVHRSASRLPS
jgi:hypothetical protein